MAKRFVVMPGDGTLRTFTSKLSYLKWAISHRAGWKHLIALPVFALLWLRHRKDLEKIHEHMKAGKAWDAECEKVIGEALYPKPPKRSAEGPEKPL